MNIKFKTIFEYILILCAILCSGTVIFNIKYNSVFIPFFVLLTIVYNIVLNGKKLKIKYNIYALGLILGIILINTIIHINDQVSLNGIIQMFLYVIGVCFLSNSIGLKSFMKKYINIVVILAVIAVIIFYLVKVGWLKATFELVNGKIYTTSFLHILGWNYSYFSRLSGLFHEPGMFQIILNVALLFLANNILENKNKKKLKFYSIQLIILVIAVILTKSTSGYLALNLVLIGFFLKLGIKLKGKKKTIFFLSMIPIAVVITIFLLNSDVVTLKMKSTNVSYSIRSNDLVSGLQIILDRPIFGLGYLSNSYYSTIFSYDINNISNGLIQSSIMFGIPFIIIYLGLLIKNTQNNRYEYPKIMIILIILLEECVESWMFFPISLFFIFNWKIDTEKEEEKLNAKNS